MEMEADRVVGGYRIERPLGSGAMGEVYLVRHLERNTLHALKYMSIPSRRVRRRLLREAEVQTRLSHPNVVSFTEVIEIDGDPGLVMEYVDGPTLDDWLKAHRPGLPQAEALFRGILAGVAHAHRKGLVHRDLKPSNVLLARTAAGVVPKVADFGIAKLLQDAPDGSSGLTRTGTSLGSPAYMAPEQIRDARDVDHRADLYSLGAILYELVCGDRAFQGKDVLQVMNAAAEGRFDDPRTKVEGLPEHLARAIEACLVVDRDQRVASCEQLQKVLGGSGTTTTGDDPERAGLVPLAVAMGVLITLALAAWWFAG